MLLSDRGKASRQTGWVSSGEQRWVYSAERRRSRWVFPFRSGIEPYVNHPDTPHPAPRSLFWAPMLRGSRCAGPGADIPVVWEAG